MFILKWIFRKNPIESLGEIIDGFEALRRNLYGGLILAGFA